MLRPDPAVAVRSRRPGGQRRLDAGRESVMIAATDRVRTVLRGWEAEYRRLLAACRAAVAEVRQRLRVPRAEVVRLEGLVREVHLLQVLAGVIRRARRPGTVFRALRACTAQVVPVLDCEMFFLGGAARRLVPLRRRRRTDRLCRLLHLYLEEGVVDWLLDNGRATVTPDLDTIPAGGAAAAEHSDVLIPMIRNGRGIGVYAVHTSRGKEAVTLQELETLLLLTEHAATAIAHLRLAAGLTPRGPGGGGEGE